MAFSFLPTMNSGARRALLAVAAGLMLAGSVGAAHADSEKSWFGFGSATKKPAGNWHNAAPIGKATTVTEVINDGSVSPFIAPESGSEMQAAIGRYQAIAAQGGWPQINSMGAVKKGSQGKGVATLNQRLFAEGYVRKEATEGEFAARFTTATEDALKRFQRNHGLFVTGRLDTATIKELNIPVEKRLATMRANLPRLEEYSKDLGARYVTVNIPAMQLETVNNGVVYSRHNAIVGRPSRPTPVVQTALATVKFNPYWNSPASIVEKDIIPRMISGGPSKVLRDMNITVFKGVGGPEVDPDDVNWRTAVADDYHFRQEPGGDNAMATAKIEFPSPFGVYLHDTPDRQLFGGGMRFLSSGCVRVDKVAIFINWILQGQDGIDQSRIADLADTKERLDVKINNAPQLRFAYLTAWPNRNGEVSFRPDIYELDGSGFVVGQPLDVDAKGERFVLKPIPRSASAVDADEATGFFLFFGSSKKKPAASMKSGDLTPPAKGNWVSGGAKTASAKTNSKKTTGKSIFASGKDQTAKKTAAKTKTGAQCKPGKDGKLPAGCKPSTTAGKKPDNKAASTKTASAKATDTKAATAKTATDAASTCKPGKDGKLPTGCKPAATTSGKKPVDTKATTEKTAAPAAKDKAVTVAKASDECKPGTDGKLPAGCKPKVEVKPADAAKAASN